MPGSGLKPPWPRITERDERQGIVPANEMHLGHPTAPGLREERQPRAGGPSPGNGIPGVPRLIPGRRGTAGFPANTGGGYPVQGGENGPGYDGPNDF